MKEVDPHPPTLCMANELLALVLLWARVDSSRGSNVPDPATDPRHRSGKS